MKIWRGEHHEDKLNNLMSAPRNEISATVPASVAHSAGPVMGSLDPAATRPAEIDRRAPAGLAVALSLPPSKNENDHDTGDDHSRIQEPPLPTHLWTMARPASVGKLKVRFI